MIKLSSLQGAGTRAYVLVAVFVLGLAACGTDDGPAQGSLEGSHWQLVAIQSMDDAVGTTEPENPTLYTMSLAEDGTVAMRLNCNRATGTWSAEPGEGGESGSFTFGPLAMTRALCPPPSLDERIARDAEFVRSFLLRDGYLNLSLLADGGIYTWAPSDPPPPE